MISIPLPGEEDSVYKEMLPLVPGLIYEFGDAMKDAARGREEKNPMMVREAAERIAGKALNFGLTKLERMARCVERAAAADDVEPMECVLEDLEQWVTRYKEALRVMHRDMKW
jgi:HPt (histidine-containing phosphotransfer) domain-containing protein